MSRNKGYMKKLRELSADRSGERERKKMVLYLAVAGVMAFIVVLWFMVLPIQMAGLHPGGLSSALAPKPAPSGQDFAASWNEMMLTSSQNLERLTSDLQKPAANSAPTAGAVNSGSLDAASLTARLDAATATAPAPKPAK